MDAPEGVGCAGAGQGFTQSGKNEWIDTLLLAAKDGTLLENRTIEGEGSVGHRAAA